MGRKTRPAFGAGRVSLVPQILLWQVVVIAVSLGIGATWRISTADEAMRHEYAQRALAISKTVASDPDVQSRLSRLTAADLDAERLAGGELQAEAEAVTERTDVLFVVIANRDGIRLSHPDLSQLGQPVSTDARSVLAGNDVLDTDRGTLGESVRGKAPVRGNDGTVLGFVSTGISTADVTAERNRDIQVTITLSALALAVGIVGSALLARRWRRLTLGLQPDQLVGLVGEQRAVLHSLADGVLSIDQTGRVRMANDRAKELLGIDPPTGAALSELDLPARLLEVAQTQTPSPVALTTGERIVLASSHKVVEAGRDLGMVVSIVDRTDVELLTRELDTVRSMSEALRAQRHETANRHHVLAGLLRHGHIGEATAYLEQITGAPGTSVLEGLENIAEPHLCAFLDAKATRARERGVTLTLGPQTWVPGELVDPVAATTVVGNLVDNAIEAAVEVAINGPAAGAGSAAGADSVEVAPRPVVGIPRVEVELFAQGDTLWAIVSDSGRGIAFADPEDVFSDGATTKDGAAVPGGRGLGLALARRICRKDGGELRLADPGGASSDLGGAVFVAEIRTMVRGEADGAAVGEGEADGAAASGEAASNAATENTRSQGGPSDG